MKSILFTLISLIAGPVHAELAKDCPWNCRGEIEYNIDARYFVLNAPNPETRQQAIKALTLVAVDSQYLKVKMRALEALKPSTYVMNHQIRALALESISDIAAYSNDAQLEHKALQILAHSLKAENSDIRLLAAKKILKIASQSDQKMTQNMAMNLIDRSADAHTLKTMLANQSK